MLGLIQMNNCNNRLINKNLDYHKIDENGLKCTFGAIFKHCAGRLEFTIYKAWKFATQVINVHLSQVTTPRVQQQVFVAN